MFFIFSSGHKILQLFFLISLLIIFPVVAFGGADVTVDAFLDNSAIEIGASATYNIEVIAESGINLEIPEISRDMIAGLPVVDSGMSGPEESGGRNHLAFWYRLEPEQSGDYIIAPLVIVYHVDGKRLQVETEQLFLRVTDSEVDRDDLRPLKPIAVLQREGLRQWMYTAAILSLALMLFLLFYFKKKTAKAVSEIVISPYERAMSALRELKIDMLSHPDRIREFYFRISEIYRRYLEEVYNVGALESTSHEIMNDTKLQKAVDGQHLEEVAVFLEMTDRVKFAKYNPSKTEMDELYSLSIRLVDKSAQ